MKRTNAWIPKVRTAEEIGTAAGTNRWTGWPYTKYMVANDNMDAAPAWLMCSVRIARRLKVSKDKRVYIHSGAQAHEGAGDQRFLSHRADTSRLPGMEAALTNCFEVAGYENTAQVSAHTHTRRSEDRT